MKLEGRPSWFIARQGLHELLSNIVPDRSVRKYWSPVDLEKHPFDLLIPTRQKTDERIFNHRPQEFLFFGWPTYTDVSVKNFLHHLAEHFQYNPAAPNEVIYLRQVNVQTEPHCSPVYVLFEVGLLTKTIMCGGCTNGSGAGGEGRTILESVFALLSLTNNITVEKVKITYPQGAKFFKELLDTVERLRKGLTFIC